MDSKTMPKCAICGTPTTSKCTGCESKFYCGEPCQSKDWHSHKKVCKVMQLEKTLGRVAELVHEAYLTFRENTFDTSTLKIEETKDALVMRNGYLTARTKSFVDSPRHIMKDDAMRKAVPCWLSCHEPFAWMHSLIRKLVEGLKITIEEVAVRLRWIPRKSIVINPNGKSHHNGPGYLHFVLRVTSTDTGLKWALDFSGAQYGIFPVLWRWHDYEKCFIDIGKQLELYSHGVNRTLVAAWAEVEGAPFMAFGVIGRSAKGLDTSITLWEKDFMPCLSSLMSQDDENFSSNRAKLFAAMDSAVRDFVRSNDMVVKFNAMIAYETSNPGLSSRRSKELPSGISEAPNFGREQVAGNQSEI